MKVIQKKAVRALASKVLAVAVANINEETNEILDWSCYVDAVEGRDHQQEFEAAASTGAKQPERIARVLFPGLDISKYRL